MGNPTSKIKRVNQFKEEEWRLVQTEKGIEVFEDAGRRQAVINYIDVSSFDKQIVIYNQRRNTSMPYIKCYAAEQYRTKESKNATMKVLTERIARRWQDFYQLTFPQILYVLSETLRGYEGLYKQIGGFKINERMFGVNRNGHLRVWLNQEFASNHKSLTSNKQEIITQATMVKQVLDFVEERCEQGRYPKNFRQQIHQNSEHFSKCLGYLKAYIAQRKILLPPAIHPDSNMMYYTGVTELSPSKSASEKHSNHQSQVWLHGKFVESELIRMPANISSSKTLSPVYSMPTNNAFSRVSSLRGPSSAAYL